MTRCTPRTALGALLFLMAVLSPVSATGARIIGVSLLTHEHQFYRDLETGLRTEAAKRGYRLIITSGEFDLDKQAQQIDGFIERKVHAILLAPCNSRAIGGSIVKINASGIPVFTVDIAAGPQQGSVVSHIASDNIDGGRHAARMIARALNGTGKVTIISHPEVSSVFDRVVGFRGEMQKHPGIKIIAEIPAWGQRDRAMRIMEEILLKIPDVDAVFGINDDSALGALDACERAGKKIVIVGYDATIEAKEAIMSGRIYGDVVQYPKKIGTIAIRKIDDYFNGVHVPQQTSVPVGIFTKGNDSNACVIADK
jgi:ribose transport system substrate-binding protein